MIDFLTFGIQDKLSPIHFAFRIASLSAHLYSRVLTFRMSIQPIPRAAKTAAVDDGSQDGHRRNAIIVCPQNIRQFSSTNDLHEVCSSSLKQSLRRDIGRQLVQVFDEALRQQIVGSRHKDSSVEDHEECVYRVSDSELVG